MFHLPLDYELIKRFFSNLNHSLNHVHAIQRYATENIPNQMWEMLLAQAQALSPIHTRLPGAYTEIGMETNTRKTQKRKEKTFFQICVAGEYK